ncbi:MAG: hypothetical protein PVF73_05795 [Bacteroidales bacterium]|jgi:enamine deaminase RidA (YjgF/YER057c/UK114 family)
MKNNIKRVFIKPDKGEGFDGEIESCFEKIQEKSRSGKGTAVTIQLSFFVRSKSKEDFLLSRKKISAFLNEKFDNIPAYSVIAQPPADNLLVSVELTLLENMGSNTTVACKAIRDVPYTVIRSVQGKEIYAAGITSENPNDNLRDQVEDSYKLMNDVLTEESMSFSDIVRQWNYVEEIVSLHRNGERSVQNYQVLNDIRSFYYSQSEFTNGFPAATGIGMNYGGVLIEFYAVKPLENVKILPVKNPNQVDAYNYSQKVLIGNSFMKLQEKTTPKFERAKFISLNGHKNIFISGTASIHNEKTIGLNDVRKQTVVTIDNISNLVSLENLVRSGFNKGRETLTYLFLRIYVKNEADMPVVKEICNNYFEGIQVSYLIADICRDDLLVEIEGVAELK